LIFLRKFFISKSKVYTPTHKSSPDLTSFQK
jgi:hypothetical protein